MVKDVLRLHMNLGRSLYICIVYYTQNKQRKPESTQTNEKITIETVCDGVRRRNLLGPDIRN